MLHHRIFLLCFTIVRTSENLGDLSNIFDQRYSLIEAATERCSLKIALHLITLNYNIQYSTFKVVRF